MFIVMMANYRFANIERQEDFSVFANRWRQPVSCIGYGASNSNN
jgi:hypothetical protein